MPARTARRGRPAARLLTEWLEPRDLPSAAFDITGLTALRNDPAFADIDGQTDGGRIGIAVLDTGAYGNHPDLRGNLVAYVDAVRNDRAALANMLPVTDPGQVGPEADPIGHGSHVAGTAASTNPDIGVATRAGLIAVRVIPGPGEQPQHNTLVTGLEWVIANQQRYNIRVVNMSLGFPTNFNSLDGLNPDAIAQAIDRLEELGVTVVSASGNSYAQYVSPGASYPAIFSTVSVASTWEDAGAGDGFPFGPKGGQSDQFFATDIDAAPDRLAATSQRSQLPNQVAAPGATIFSTFNGSADERTGQQKLYETYDGTSMASPFVAGVVALMQDAAFTAAGRYLTPDAVLAILRETADTITDSPTGGNARYDAATGQYTDLPETGLPFLRVNAYRAVAAAREAVGGGGGG
ncbi:MAG: S8 family serine peptidase, partial [Gemmataceae bacterium]|nr:S8 family serine peptidase [Gemmataceae bacterium]